MRVREDYGSDDDALLADLRRDDSSQGDDEFDRDLAQWGEAGAEKEEACGADSESDSGMQTDADGGF